MKTILNSILLFSLISTPLDKFESKVYRLYSNKLKTQKEENQEINADDINNIIEEIDDNFNIISNLLTEKNQLSNNINYKFEQKIKNKEKLSEQQIACFQENNNVVIEEEKNISTYTSKIHNKKHMINLENELLSNKTNFNIIYKKLIAILNNQMKVIASLYKAIFHLKLSLEIL